MARRHRPSFPLSPFSSSPSSRSGFELAIGTLVVMILGILIVGGGIVLLAKVLTFSGNLLPDQTAQQRTDINRQLQTQLVAVSPQSQTVVAGKTFSVAFGIDNRQTVGSYDIGVTGVDNASNPVPFSNSASAWKSVFITPLEVKQYARGAGVIALTPGSAVPSGTYTFFLNVSSNGVTYDSDRFFTVKVE